MPMPYIQIFLLATHCTVLLLLSWLFNCKRYNSSIQNGTLKLKPSRSLSEWDRPNRINRELVKREKFYCETEGEIEEYEKEKYGGHEFGRKEYEREEYERNNDYDIDEYDREEYEMEESEREQYEREMYEREMYVREENEREQYERKQYEKEKGKLLKDQLGNVEFIMNKALNDGIEKVQLLTHKLLNDEVEKIRVQTDKLLKDEKERTELLIDKLLTGEILKVQVLMKKLKKDKIINYKIKKNEITSIEFLLGLIDNMEITDEEKVHIKELVKKYVHSNNPFVQVKIYNEIKEHTKNEQCKNRKRRFVNFFNLDKRINSFKKTKLWENITDYRVLLELAKHISFDTLLHVFLHCISTLSIYVLPAIATLIIAFYYIMRDKEKVELWRKKYQKKCKKLLYKKIKND
ncbi:Plasmodium exported protein, unknown function [Plasmodium ovale]|uniref:Uncharacterized protein n=2 Tax=Plasmodium ovale TaxID=36330 RepID=A0A1A8XF35_PLAOA|nr:Plasmodium exported protein, unknown function [Plasmodium ovale curtisi]SBT02492.1 Plasmodium exported protein, unknown function [Plasmodium ovale curtisi]SBT83131.1 Plasmodium exported protein, unknown function [Plasmodium ovale]